MNKTELFKQIMADTSVEEFEKAMKIEVKILSDVPNEGGAALNHETLKVKGAKVAGDGNLPDATPPGLPQGALGETPETVLSADDSPVASQFSSPSRASVEVAARGGVTSGGNEMQRTTSEHRTPGVGVSGAVPGVVMKADEGRGSMIGLSSRHFLFVRGGGEDQRIVEAMQKGNIYGEPTLGHPMSPLTASRECHLCKSATPAFLSECTSCGDAGAPINGVPGVGYHTLVVDRSVNSALRPAPAPAPIRFSSDD